MLIAGERLSLSVPQMGRAKLFMCIRLDIDATLRNMDCPVPAPADKSTWKQCLLGWGFERLSTMCGFTIS